MGQNEESSIRETIHLVMEWIRARKPGPVSADWRLERTGAPLVLSLAFPLAHLTEEESRFLPGESQVFSMNGSTPRTCSTRAESVAARA